MTEKVAPRSVRVDQAYDIGWKQVLKNQGNLPKGNYSPQAKTVVTVETMNQLIDIGDTPVYDANLIMSIALQLSRNASMSEVLKFELSPIPTSMFPDSGDMRSSASKPVRY